MYSEEAVEVFLKDQSRLYDERGLSIYGSSVDQAKPALEKWSKKD